MAYVRVPETDESYSDLDSARAFLKSIGIDYGTWKSEHELSESPDEAEILEAYRQEIETLKQEGGYVTADVIAVTPETPGLDAMLEKFAREHWHDEDEVRFVIEGNGVFHIHPKGGKVVAIEVEVGDFIRVPKGTLHWFNLCSDKTIKCIRLFQDPSGWTPHYSESGMDESFMQVCMGPSFIPPSRINL